MNVKTWKTIITVSTVIKAHFKQSDSFSNFTHPNPNHRRCVGQYFTSNWYGKTQLQHLAPEKHLAQMCCVYHCGSDTWISPKLLDSNVYFRPVNVL